MGALEIEPCYLGVYIMSPDLWKLPFLGGSRPGHGPGVGDGPRHFRWKADTDKDRNLQHLPACPPTANPDQAWKNIEAQIMANMVLRYSRCI